MFHTLLEELSKVKIPLIGRIEENENQLINTTIFGKNFHGDTMKYKKSFFHGLRRKESVLLQIQEKTYKEILSKKERNILLEEIENRLLKVEFLRNVYNIEAQKIDPTIQIYYSQGIDIYNKAFFGVTKKDIGDHNIIQECPIFENIYKKSVLLELIKYSQSICPEIQFKFGKYPNFSHSAGVLRIPNQKYYNLQNIITLFFHEVTHFFRSFNGERNMGFKFQFAGYSSLEEGIAIYNEYLYGNKICNYGSFIPYYNICIKYLLQDVSEEEKKENIYQVLSCKGFSRERSLQYYNRFYKYCKLGETHLFLKDLIYYNGYKNVKKLIRKDSHNYDAIMAGDIGLEELQANIVDPYNNYDYKKYFRLMTKRIKEIQK